jgi:DNA-directed RNA polymerase specialized sigma24 family protein
MFTTYLHYPLKNCFEAATGGRGNSRAEPLNGCASLDAPVGEERDAAFVDMVPDKNAGAAFEAVEDGMVNSQLRAALDDFLSTLPEIERDVIKRRYYGGYTRRQVAKQIGAEHERVRQIELRGLQKLRHPSNRDRLMSVQDVIDSAYQTSGLRRFRDTGYSSVELAYERIEAVRAEGRLEPEQCNP